MRYSSTSKGYRYQAGWRFGEGIEDTINQVDSLETPALSPPHSQPVFQLSQFAFP